MRPLQDWSIRWKAGLHLLIILLLVTMHLVGVWWFPEKLEHKGTAINEAGEQRMLTQQIALQAHQIRMGNDEKRDELSAKATEYDRTLSALIEGNETMGIPPAPPVVREQLLIVQSEWEPFYAHVQTVIEEPETSTKFNESLAYVEANNGKLLAESDRAVQRYERVYESRIQRNQQFFLGLVVLDLLVIPLLFVFIDRRVLRAVNQMANDAQTVAEGSFDRSITHVEAMDEIGRLSRSLQEMKNRLVSAVQEVKRFEHAVEHAGHAIFITDAEGTIEYVNLAFEEITKYNEAQAVGKTPRILEVGRHHQPDYDAVWGTTHVGDVWEDDIVIKRATGELLHVFQTVAPITDAEDEIVGFVAILADNTDQLVNAQQTQVLSRVLRHNLRTELNLIDGFARELATAADDNTRTKYLNKIRTSVDDLVHLSDMSERIIRACQPESYRQPQGVCTAIERVRTTADKQYPEASITTNTPDYEIDILLNIELVLEELVENAIEHNDCAIPNVTITASLQEESEPPPMVCIEVADTGPGIPTVERKVLETGEETPLFHGSGLGLWLVHWVITLAGGVVTIEEQSPQGTRVALTVPRASVRPFVDESPGADTDANTTNNDTTTTHDHD